MPFTKSTPLSSPPQIEGERDLTQRSTSLLPIQNPWDSFSKTHIESHLRSPQCSNFYLPLFSSSSCKKRTSPTVVWFLSLLFFFFAMELAKSRLYMCNCFSPTRFSDYSVAGSDYPDAIGAINFNSIPNSSYFSIRCLWSSISISNLFITKKECCVRHLLPLVMHLWLWLLHHFPDLLVLLSGEIPISLHLCSFFFLRLKDWAF